MAAIAACQFGRIRYDQLRAAGAGRATIHRWRDSGYLHHELPRVYAVGHPGRSAESDLAAALLYAGPGAALTAGTALWWLGLLKFAPALTHLSTPRRVADRDGIVIRRERRLTRAWRNGLPTTSVAHAVLDFAATDPPAHLVRFALASADYCDMLDVNAIRRATGRGIKGSEALNHALDIHLPELAHTRSDGEIQLLAVCQEHGVPIPETNVLIQGHRVDALWRERRVIVEIDGLRGHRTRAQLERDHQRDLDLRAIGYIVLRYTWRQLIESPALVAAELRRYLGV